MTPDQEAAVVRYIAILRRHDQTKLQRSEAFIDIIKLFNGHDAAWDEAAQRIIDACGFADHRWPLRET